ncbi:MAG TPA: lysylphosphatidylglycerol synthase transmembrane domain-containing protein [Bryobacteraceae bacterium]|nr:lysylphosphatidylglycerol synthase transmembrane domain-containing protein [Bryobacteraceae bacterium]
MAEDYTGAPAPPNHPPAPGGASPGPFRSRRNLLFLVAVLGLFAAWFFRERWMASGFDWQAFARSFINVHWGWMAASVVLALATYLGRALRWRVMLRPLKPDANLWRLCTATAIGFTAVVLLGRPGEFVRPYLIARKEAVPVSSQLAVWFLERIWDLMAVLLIFGFALAQVRHSRVNLGPRFAWILETGGYLVTAAALVAVIVLIALGGFSGAMRQRLLSALAFLPEQHHRRADRVVTAFLEGAASTKSGSSLFLLLSYTVAEWAVILLGMGCLFWAYPATAHLGIRDVLIFTGFVAFGGLVQIPGIGGGIQIVSIFVLTEFFGVPLEAATAIAIMIWAVTFVVIVPVGLGLAFREGLNWRQFRQLKSEAVERAEAAGGDSGLREAK